MPLCVGWRSKEKSSYSNTPLSADYQNTYHSNGIWPIRIPCFHYFLFVLTVWCMHMYLFMCVQEHMAVNLPMGGPEVKASMSFPPTWGAISPANPELAILSSELGTSKLSGSSCLCPLSTTATDALHPTFYMVAVGSNPGPHASSATILPTGLSSNSLHLVSPIHVLLLSSSHSGLMKMAVFWIAFFSNKWNAYVLYRLDW